MVFVAIFLHWYMYGMVFNGMAIPISVFVVFPVFLFFVNVVVSHVYGMTYQFFFSVVVVVVAIFDFLFVLLLFVDLLIILPEYKYL